MITIKINPTRMECSRLKAKLRTAMCGHKLLKDKRDELMRNFLNLARENKDLRKKVEIKILQANKNFALARAAIDEEAVMVAMMAPKQEVEVKVKSKNVMGALIPQFYYKTRTGSQNDVYSYGLAFTSGDLDLAAEALADALPEMIQLAECEKACQLMAAEIEKTRRRVNALEHIMIPDMRENIRYITARLDENERATQTRLMKVKELIR